MHAGSIDLNSPGAVFKWLLRSWRLLSVAALVGGAAGATLSGIVTPWYHSTAQLAIVPVDDPTSTSGTSGVEGANASLPLLMAVLGSNGVLDAAVQQLHLMETFGVDTPEKARRRLKKRLLLSADRKNNLVTLTVEAEQPGLARDTAKVITELGRQRSAHLWASRSREHRERLEVRLGEVEKNLKSAEAAMRAFREKNHVFDVAEQVKASVAEAAALEHVRVEKSLAARYARSFGSDDSVEVARNRTEERGTQEALQSMGSGQSKHSALLPLDDIPKLEEEYAQLKRAIDANGANYEFLARQVEQLRAVESRPAGRAELIDAPSLPGQPAGPSRVWWTLQGVLIALCVASFGLLLALWRRSQPELE